MPSKTARIFLTLLLTIFFAATAVFGKDYFLYDLEKNKILAMGQDEEMFSEKADLEKNPDRLLPSNDPDKYLAIFTPETGNKKKEDQAGKLVVINIATGRTEDFVELGFAPFKWVYTEDRKHFFITYKNSSRKSADQFELLHYDLTLQKSEKMALTAKMVSRLSLSFDETKLYLVSESGDKEEPILNIDESGKAFVLSYSPLKIEKKLKAQNPKFIFGVGPERLVLLDVTDNGKEGSVKYINTANFNIEKEQKIKNFYRYYSYWYKDEKVLILMISAKTDYGIKVSATGMIAAEIPSNWINYEYLADKDKLYILTVNDLKVIEYKPDSIICDLKGYSTKGRNVYSNGGATYYYRFNRLPESDLAAIYCQIGGSIKFFDLNSNSLLKEVRCGRAGRKILKAFLNGLVDQEFSVCANQAKTKFFILNTATNDITVYDKNFEKLDYIVPPENLLEMFQIKKPIQSIVVTSKKVYKLNDLDLTLVPIHEFSAAVRWAYCFDDKNRIIILTSKELLVINADTLAVKNCFQLFGEPDDKYTKLKKGEQRYYFIPTL